MKIVTGLLLFTSIYSYSFAWANVNIWVWVNFDINQCLESKSCKNSVNNILSLDKVNTILTDAVQQNIYNNKFWSYSDEKKGFKTFNKNYWKGFDKLDTQNKKIDNILMAFNSYFNVNRDIYNKNNKNKYWNLKADYEKEQKDFCNKLNSEDKKWLYRAQETFLSDYIMLNRDDNKVIINENINNFFDSKFSAILKYDERKIKFCSYDFSWFYTFTQQYQVINNKLNNTIKVINANLNYQKYPTTQNWEIVKSLAEQYKKLYWVTTDINQRYLDLKLQVNEMKTNFKNKMNNFK